MLDSSESQGAGRSADHSDPGIAGYEWTDRTGRMTHVGKAPPASGAYNITLLQRAGSPALRPKVLVEVSGGVVQSVTSDLPVDVIVADYDVDLTEQSAVTVLEQPGAAPEPAALSRHVESDPQRVTRIFAASEEQEQGTAPRERARG